MQVRKRDTSRIYALKTIRKAHIVSRSEVTHTLAERTVLAQVNNPFIVPLKFSFQSPEKLYLVLAFVNGGELFHHLQKEGRFSLERARFYAAELLCALECLHGMDVIYRYRQRVLEKFNWQRFKAGEHYVGLYWTYRTLRFWVVQAQYDGIR